MVKDTLNKLRALVSMKTTIIKQLSTDLRVAELRIIHLDVRVKALEEESSWWKALDKEQERLGARDDEDMVDVPMHAYVPEKPVKS